ncbi:nickel-type superoxide dismutase maturation protease [Lyngbya confervoides]|uniref:Nickel-type superoxide dismutase maturation protease n=1 Tax=Lyngbya confervoides BDU141951 TaxID=1574623 RepID=A0ABD4T4U8_9CYAN|nr:nickel-type superoxide dismutase maturation protease [Lyngbya confervoides]MCM1983539.1 nickel-type superoxide dismutase maturation protease [Lyngbya confervoides BDU141951]
MSPPSPVQLINGVEFLLWLAGRRQRLVVYHRSMVPTLQPGDEILFNPRSYTQRRPQPGEIIVLVHPQQPGLPLVKRVERILEEKIWVVGDNGEASTDSRQFGAVDLPQVLGQVTCIFSRPVLAVPLKPPARR